MEFADKNPTIDATLHKKKGSIVEEIPNKEANSHQSIPTIQQYSITIYPGHNPININRPKAKDIWEVEGFSSSSGQFIQPLEIKEVHTG